MATLHPIRFDFSEEENNGPKEFLSRRPIEPEPQKPKSRRGRKSTKDLEAEGALMEIPEDEILFKKQYYPIGEVAAMFNVNAALLRHWEAEFGMELRKNRKGDRFFKPADIKTLQLIYDLIRRRKFTTEGAREYLNKNKGAEEKYALIESLQKLRTFLLQLKANL